MATAKATVDTRGINAQQQRFLRLFDLMNETLEVGWPVDAPDVDLANAWKAHWLEHGRAETRTSGEQRARPFLSMAAARIRQSGPRRIKLRMVDIIAGRESTANFWDAEAEMAERMILQELERMSISRPLEESTLATKRGRSRTPGFVGRDTGNMLSQLTYIVVDVRNN